MVHFEASSEFLIGAAIGSGTTALAAERGDADFLLAINAGRLRNMGAPSIACMLPIFDAASLMEDFARRELLTQCRIPVLLGVNVWEPRFDPVGRAAMIRDSGFAGAVNFPSCMHYSRPMQQILSRARRGIEQEVEMLRAVQDTGLSSMFYCATRTQARLAADAGIDLVCLNLGWNVGGALGHRRRASIEEVATVARDVGRLIKRINPDTRFLLEGGPIANAEELARVVSLAPIDGYVGGSTIERIPLENSVADQIHRFRQASRRGPALDSAGARLVAWSGQFGFVGRSEKHLAYLRRLKALTAARDPVLLLAEQGISPRPSLAALGHGRKPGGSPVSVHIDIAGEDLPTHARNRLFGHRDTLAKQSPALADDGISLLVIHAPERLPPATQRRLARALRDGEFTVTGTRRSMEVAPRVVLVCYVPVTPGRVEEDLAGAGLDPDLGAVMTGGTLRVPPLRERTDDLLAVIEQVSASALGVSMGRSLFSPAALKRLQAHRWPGNEVELRSVLGALAGRSSQDPVQPAEVVPLLEKEPVPVPEVRSEKDLVVDALWRHGFNRTQAAAALGVSRKTLYNKIRKFGLSG
ncbi:MAG: phosphoenolpyruvate hydrolase family protein [Gammaproteobacteria bacterium]|nr:phosphoenolpyruvate hydrolase family protein [Gammaproteobacteria bacterium]